MEELELELVEEVPSLHVPIALSSLCLLAREVMKLKRSLQQQRRQPQKLVQLCLHLLPAGRRAIVQLVRVPVVVAAQQRSPPMLRLALPQPNAHVVPSARHNLGLVMHHLLLVVFPTGFLLLSLCAITLQLQKLPLCGR